jgi:Na+-transporting methylmalonyl-CoA/oxaloacetate decarboxylase gamma subunit
LHGGLKTFTLGLGVGIIILALVIYLVYGISRGAEPETIPAPLITDEDIIARAQDLGMIFYSELPKTVPTATPAPTAAPQAAPLSDEEIIARARELGMTYVQAEADETPAETPAPYVTVDIPEGLGSLEIATILQEHGVVDDATAFNNYIISLQAARILPFGSFVFPLGLEYSQVYELLQTR